MGNKLLIVGIAFMASLFLFLPVKAATSISDITDVAEFGSVTLDDDWATVMLNTNYTNPVVIMKPISYNGADPSHIRLRSVSEHSFQAKVEEWSYLDGTHTSETVYYIVMEAGTYTLDGKKIEAGTISSIKDSWTAVSFGETFSTTPVLLTQSQTYFGIDPIVTRNKDIDTTGFDVKVQEEEAKGTHDKGEKVGYIAAEAGIYEDAGTTTSFEAMKTSDSVTNSWATINYGQSYTSPLVMADMQTTDGTDTAGLRYKDKGGSSVKIMVEEEKSSDAETTHVTEVVGLFILE